jgi:hypothetical protein
MRTITATGVVSPDHTLTVSVPADIPPGPQTVVVVLEESPPVSQSPWALQLTPHPVGLVDPHRSFRREDVYGDDGR